MSGRALFLAQAAVIANVGTILLERLAAVLPQRTLFSHAAYRVLLVVCGLAMMSALVDVIR